MKVWPSMVGREATLNADANSRNVDFSALTSVLVNAE